MKFKVVVSLILAVALFVFSCDTNESDPPPENNDEIILYEKWPFLVGAAVPGAKTPGGSALLTSSRQHDLLKHFNVLAAENEMKPYNIMPTNNPGSDFASWSSSYEWTNSDALVNYAKENNKKIRGHVLIWHDQTPDWFFQGSGDGGRATIDELYERMENHIRTVFEKYKGDVEWWDVVNEPIDHDASGPRMDSRGRYTEIMIDAGKTGLDRYEYIFKAFEWARQYADANGGENVKLYLTEFGVERPFSRGGTTKQQDFYDLAEWLVEKDAPIDGIGFQGHFRLYDHPVEQISAGIDKFSVIKEKKLMLQICELDFSIFSNAKGEAGAQTVSSGVLDERLSDLANTYREFFDMFKEKYNEGKLDLVLIWGLADGHSWLNEHPVKGRTDHPLLFNRNYKGKEAYWKLVN